MVLGPTQELRVSNLKNRSPKRIDLNLGYQVDKRDHNRREEWILGSSLVNENVHNEYTRSLTIRNQKMEMSLMFQSSH